MYFAVVGNKSFASHELMVVYPKNLKRYTDNIVVFDTTFPDLLFQCGQVIKRGKVIDKDVVARDFPFTFSAKSVVGTSKIQTGMILKKVLAAYGIRRFKRVDLFHTDREVKEDGVEIIELSPQNQGGSGKRNDEHLMSPASFFSSCLYGIVLGYQNIALYEMIDFEKPVRGMEIGMMPAKLATFLVNVAKIVWERQIKKLHKKETPSYKHTFTVWDPFVGFGTTSFVAYAMGYNAIGSDKNITSAKKNLHRRNTKKQVCFFENVLHAQDLSEQKLFFFKHDVTRPFTQKVLYHVDVVVTEGWLGPRIRHFHIPVAVLQKNQEEIWSVYKSFLENVRDFFSQSPKSNTPPVASTENFAKPFPPIVMTIPWYVQIKQSIAPFVAAWCAKQGFHCYVLPDIYKRAGQTVGRQIVVVTDANIDASLIF